MSGDHGSKVWRVCWNITGTIMGSTGDDGYVRLWKANYLGNWKCICKLKIDPDDQMTLSSSIVNNNLFNSTNDPGQLNDSNLNPNSQNIKTRYYKIGSMTNNTVPLH